MTLPRPSRFRPEHPQNAQSRIRQSLTVSPHATTSDSDSAYEVSDDTDKEDSARPMIISVLLEILNSRGKTKEPARALTFTTRNIQDLVESLAREAAPLHTTTDNIVVTYKDGKDIRRLATGADYDIFIQRASALSQRRGSSPKQLTCQVQFSDETVDSINSQSDEDESRENRKMLGAKRSRNKRSGVAKTSKGTSKAPRVTDLTPREIHLSEMALKLKEKYHCEVCGGPCWRPDGVRHQKIMPLQIATWATMITNGEATLAEPPTSCGFEVRHGAKGHRNEQFAVPECVSTVATDPSTAMISKVLLAGLSAVAQTSHSPSDEPITSRQASPSPVIPSMADFLFDIDTATNSSDTFSTYLEAMEHEAVTVDMLSGLTDDEFRTLGVDKIGHRIRLRKSASKYRCRDE
jgi:SAM domain (Sterile alpha motif)